MSEIINKFNIFRDFPSNLCQNIKSFHVLSDQFDELGYCVLNDNKVYGLGEDIHKILGYKRREGKYVLITELSDKNIKEFYGEKECMFARSDNNEIFSWGENVFGQLARGYQSEKSEYLPPEKISFFDDKNIIEILCSRNHCLALSSDGRVFAWGYNGVQVFDIRTVQGELTPSEIEKEKIILIPIEMDFEEKIKFIHCTRHAFAELCYAVSFHGNLYLWGYFSCSERMIPKPTELKSFIMIQSILNTREFFSDLYVLSFEGIVYAVSEENELIISKQIFDLNEELKENNIIDLCVDYEKVIGQTKDWVYVYHNSKVQKTIHKTLFEYFLFEEQKTYKTIHIKENQLFVLDFERSEQNCELIIKTFKMIYTFNVENPSLRTSKDLLKILESNVKYFYQSRKYCLYLEFLVKNDNRVYCFGHNNYGKLVLVDEERAYEYTEIIELRDKHIQQFYEGEYCMFARTDKNEIFSWGGNRCGQLARGYESNECLPPEKIDFFDGKDIIEITCCKEHCLALSSDGRVFGWGDNEYGSVGCGEEIGKFISTPIEIVFNEKIKFIHCKRRLSFAVSFDGNAYYWGGIDNFKTDERIFTPKLIPVKNVSKVGYIYFLKFYGSQEFQMKNLHKLSHLNYYDWFIILTENGKVFEFKPKNEEIIQIKSEMKFIDLYCDNSLLQTEDCVYQLKDRKLIKTDFINFKDFYSQKLNFCEKTYEITKEGYLMTKEIHFNKDKQILVLKNENIFETKYENKFEEEGVIGEGRFGEVYKVKEKSNQNQYAIKIIKMNGEFDLNEIKLLSKLDTHYVVQYLDSWIEGKVDWRKIQIHLFIQMEMCSYNLKYFIENFNKIFDKRFKTFLYFISCEILRELIECVNYLHSIPVIHRDLKPENILISEGINGRFLKLCDFGLAKNHEKSFHTRMVGTMKYMAPEVLHSNNYNTKSDIYSLALIATEIFGFEDKVIRDHKKREDFEKYSSKYCDQSLKEKFKKVLDLISNCLTPEAYHLRPDCKELLEKFNEFSVDKSIVLNDENICYFKSFFESQNPILKNFLETKINVK